MSKTPWRSREISELYQMKARGKSYTQIAAALGRSVKSVKSKYECGAIADRAIERVEPSPVALFDRDRRYSFRHTDLTAYLCGDPIPGTGQSALERRAGA